MGIIKIFGVLSLWASLVGPLVLADTASLRQKFSALKIDAVFPGDPNYEKFATAYNRRYSYRPAAIVFPNSTNAVANSVTVGVAEKLSLSARAGGHSYAAYGLGGRNGALVIDLRRIKQISVDSKSGEAVIGSGSRLGDMALDLNTHGRALPHGTCPYVGLGGHTAFGGYGFTSRQWGLTLDQLIGVEVVLANGSVTSASKTVHPDLFWALRGAGASYGIMTAMRFRTQTAPSKATNFKYDWNLSEADFANALIKFQTFCMSNLPAPLGLEANLGTSSSNDGKLQFSLTGAWYGPPEAFAAVVQPFLSQMPAPVEKSIKTTSWIGSLSGLAGRQALSTSGVDLTAEGDTFYAKSITTPQEAPMSNASILAFSKYLANYGVRSNTSWFIQVELYGGKNSAISAVPVDETSYAQRATLFTIQFYASSSDYAPPFPAAGFTFVDNMVDSIVNHNPPGWNYGAYANYVDGRLSPAQWKSLYYNKHYQRLTQIKGIYDPHNVFAYPQSITD